MIGALAPGPPDRGGGADELGEILIGRDHVGVEFTTGIGAVCECADDVIRLVAIELQHGDLKGLAEAFHLRNCGEQFLGSGIALGLVGGKFDVARGGCLSIERDAEVSGIFLFDDGEQCVREAVESGGIDALGIADGIGDKGEMRPVDQRHAIEKKQSHAGMMEKISPVVSSYRSGQTTLPSVSRFFSDSAFPLIT